MWYFPGGAGAPSFGFLLNTLKSRTGPRGFCQSPTEDHEMKSRFLFTSPESLPAGVMEIPCERGSIFHSHAHSNPLCASSGKEAMENEDCLAHKLSRKGVHQTKSWAGGRLSQSFFLPRTYVKDGPDNVTKSQEVGRKRGQISRMLLHRRGRRSTGDGWWLRPLLYR